MIVLEREGVAGHPNTVVAGREAILAERQSFGHIPWVELGAAQKAE
ncbi:MAG: hypothetical protein IT375_21565 [Polyangiaceae bacterium]|nr:hypothetical protein [Polyangiaceae bacterium]